MMSSIRYFSPVSNIMQSGDPGLIPGGCISVLKTFQAGFLGLDLDLGHTP